MLFYDHIDVILCVQHQFVRLYSVKQQQISGRPGQYSAGFNLSSTFLHMFWQMCIYSPTRFGERKATASDCLLLHPLLPTWHRHTYDSSLCCAILVVVVVIVAPLMCLFYFFQASDWPTWPYAYSLFSPSSCSGVSFTPPDRLRMWLDVAGIFKKCCSCRRRNLEARDNAFLKIPTYVWARRFS